EHLRVAVHRRQGDDHRLSRADEPPVHLDVFECGPVGSAVMQDGKVAQQLLDRLVDHCGVRSERGELYGVFQERERAQSQHVGGGLVAKPGADGWFTPLGRMTGLTVCLSSGRLLNLLSPRTTRAAA